MNRSQIALRCVRGVGYAVNAQTTPPTLRSKPVLMRQMQMSLRQPQPFLRVPRGRLVSLLTSFARLNARECGRAGPRASRHNRLQCTQRPFLCGERALAVERTNAGAYGDSQLCLVSPSMPRITAYSSCFSFAADSRLQTTTPARSIGTGYRAEQPALHQKTHAKRARVKESWHPSC